ncbi:response regulator [Mobilicoccus pelagius]|uniref:Putative two-component response regulator n=1 Tax=Mobilicoccus pelagius NBRC 104925 TaxID=1089455 RepID=H5US93_9MICO|nr:response regulator transcription factor [Mobilicoccus pelagius]GAB48601.1 putative two-component response regulator [Mobilicoccus pelagius NBRC 104925]
MTTPPTDPVRVLVVDDQELFRGSLAAVIDTQPDLTVVGEAANGLMAVEQADTLRPDVVVMDVEMPVLDGIEAAGLVRERLPHVKVVMLTVDDDDENLMRAVRLGVHGYLLKNLRPAELFDMIRAVVRGETPVAPALVGRLLAELRGTTPTPRTSAPTRPEDLLSARELEILRLVAHGLSNKEIGSRLCITEGTVKNHVHNALQKLGMENRIQAAAYIVRQGLGTPRPPGG